jgi:hypothetical protein
MQSNLGERIGLTILLAIPATAGLLGIVAVVSVAMVGPWGGALDVPPGSEQPQSSEMLSSLLKVLLVVGPLAIGWSWAGRVLARRERSWNSQRPVRGRSGVARDPTEPDAGSDGGQN